MPKTDEDFKFSIEVNPENHIYDYRGNVRREVQEWCREHFGFF